MSERRLRQAMLDLFPPAPELNEQERIIEEHIVRWRLDNPYCPAWMLAKELAEALGENRETGEG